MKTLITHVGYGRWANLQLLRAASELGKEAFRHELGGSFPSLHETFLHLLWAENLWLERWKGNSFAAGLDGGAYSDPHSLAAALEEVHAKQLDFLRRLPASAADQVVAYVNFQGQTWRYPLRDMVQHLVVHSAYHRGQAASLLRQLEAAPPRTDYLVYIDSLGQSGSAGNAGWLRTMVVRDE